MIKVDVKTLELNEFYGEPDKSHHMKATFPILGAHGTKETATVYFELEPGDQVGRHTDSAEELLFIVQGDVEIEIDGDRANGSETSLVLVPKELPHNVINRGKSTAKILGFFGGANNIITHFEQALLPLETKVVDTAQLG